MEKAIFAAGCFWGVEAAFRGIPGVLGVVVGYTGGRTEDPSYEDVCSKHTGHAEAVEVSFDPEKISYEDLLKVFWGIHDPTTMNRQGPDVGTQYRSAIFYLNEKQKAVAEASKKALQKSISDGKDIVTEVIPAVVFWRAEEYHQRYFEKHGRIKCHS